MAKKKMVMPMEPGEMDKSETMAEEAAESPAKEKAEMKKQRAAMFERKIGNFK